MTGRALRAIGVAIGLLAIGLQCAVAIASQLDPQSSWVLAWVGFPVVGVLVLLRRPGNRIGWIMVAIGLCFALIGLTNYQLASDNGAWSPAFEAALQVLNACWLLVPALIVCFPTGRATNRWDRWVIRGLFLTGGAVLTAYVTTSAPLAITGRRNPLAIPALATYDRFMLGPAFYAVIALLVGATVGLARRMSRASGVERLQYRWLLWSAGATAVILFLVNTVVGQLGVVTLLLAVMSMSLIPVAIGVAVMKYHLYDIDRVISRTSSYAIVTGVLLATYALIVTSVTRLLPDSSTLAVAAATLTAAALARPLFRRVQHAVDRRFNRARYDAEQTVDDFGTRLRHEVDTQRVSQDLVTVVHQTLQPDGAALWLRSKP